MSQFATSQIPATLRMGTTFIGGIVDFTCPELTTNITKYTEAGGDGYKQAAGHGRELGDMTITLRYTPAAYKLLYTQWAGAQTVGGAYVEQAPVAFEVDLGIVTAAFSGLIARIAPPPKGALDENAMLDCTITPTGGITITGFPT